MNAEFDWFTFLIGLPTGIAISAITYFISRKIGKKKDYLMNDIFKFIQQQDLIPGKSQLLQY